MNKLNKKVIFLSFAITAIVLFGGWFAIQFLGTEKPIIDFLEEKETVEIIDLKVDQRKLDLVIRYENDPHFAQRHMEINDFLKEVAGLKEIRLQIDPSQSEHHPWWLNQSASILEHLYAQQYTQIETIIQDWIASGVLSEGNLSMNSEAIFIYLKPKDEEPVYLYFPVAASKGGTLSD